MKKIFTEVECPECKGTGYWTSAEHGCYGDESVCASTCPVPVQQPCDCCAGTGYVEIEIDNSKKKC